MRLIYFWHGIKVLVLHGSDYAQKLCKRYRDALKIIIIIEPTHEILALFVLRKLILQTRMRSHPVELDVWFLVGPFVYFHTTCEQTAKALARLRGCAGSPEPSLVAYVISTIISWAGSYVVYDNESTCINNCCYTHWQKLGTLLNCIPC